MVLKIPSKVLSRNLPARGGGKGKVMKLQPFAVPRQLETFFRMLSISLSGKCLSGHNVSVCSNKPK